MAFNGSGLFQRLYSWISDAANNIDIDPTRMDAEMDGFATGLSTAILKDGTQTITADIPFSNKKITTLGDATAPADALNLRTADARYRRKAAAFRAHRAGTDLTGIAPSTFTKIPFPTEIINDGGFYSVATSRWTPPAGLLMIGAQAFLSGGLVDQQQTNLTLYKNGSALANLGIGGTYLTNPSAVRGEIVDFCDGDDFYELYFWANGAGSKTISGNGFNTYFYGATL